MSAKLCAVCSCPRRFIGKRPCLPTLKEDGTYEPHLMVNRCGLYQVDFVWEGELRRGKGKVGSRGLRCLGDEGHPGECRFY